MWGLVGAAVLTGVIGGVSSAQAQGTGTGMEDGRAQAEAAAKRWAEELLGEFPDYVKNAPREEKRITFQALSSDVLVGGRQRDLLYQVMLDALREVGRVGAYTFQDPRQSSRAIGRELEERGVATQQEGYRGTRFILSCSGGLWEQRIMLNCQADDMTKPGHVGSESVAFDWQWLHTPLDLDKAVLAVAGQLVKRLRGELGGVNIVDEEGKETDLTKFISRSLENRITELLRTRGAAGKPHQVKGESHQTGRQGYVGCWRLPEGRQTR